MQKRDSLLVLTAKYHLAILAWKDEDGSLWTRAHGHLADRVGRPSETGIIACVHSSGVGLPSPLEC
jgi:DNA damage-binding protein 1